MKWNLKLWSPKWKLPVRTHSILELLTCCSFDRNLCFPHISGWVDRFSCRIADTFLNWGNRCSAVELCCTIFLYTPIVRFLCWYRRSNYIFVLSYILCISINFADSILRLQFLFITILQVTKIWRFEISVRTSGHSYGWRWLSIGQQRFLFFFYLYLNNGSVILSVLLLI